MIEKFLNMLFSVLASGLFTANNRRKSLFHFHPWHFEIPIGQERNEDSQYRGERIHQHILHQGQSLKSNDSAFDQKDDQSDNHHMIHVNAVGYTPQKIHPRPTQLNQ